MAQTNEGLKKLNEEYNNSGNVPAGGFSKDDLKNHAKVKAAMNIINQAQKDVQRKAAALFDNSEISFKITSSDNKSLSDDVVNAMNFNFSGEGEKQNLEVAINFNLSKLCTYSPDVVYAVAYKTMYDGLLKKREALSGDKTFKFGKEAELEDGQPMVNDANFDRDGNYVEPKHPILDFIKKIIYKILGVSEVDSTACAKQIEENFVQNGIQPEELFENPNGSDLLVERYGKLVKQGYDQQSTALLSAISKDEFNAVKNQDDAKVRAFCEKYARVVLATNGVSENEVKITFNNQGSLGEYLDYGGMNQVVNINLQEVKRMNNPAEVIMTLSHELTHAIDSTSNKREGKTVGAKGYGLTDNLVGDMRKGIQSASDENPEVYAFVIKLQEICYRVNPNERSARYGELTAIKFMQEMNTDKTMQAYIEKSIDSYKRYQSKVLDSISQVASIQNEYEAIKPLISKNSTNKMIEERLEYISSLNQRGMLDPEQERRAIEIALNLKNKQTQTGLEMESVERSAGE